MYQGKLWLYVFCSDLPSQSTGDGISLPMTILWHILFSCLVCYHNHECWSNYVQHEDTNNDMTAMPSVHNSKVSIDSCSNFPLCVPSTQRSRTWWTKAFCALSSDKRRPVVSLHSTNSTMSYSQQNWWLSQLPVLFTWLVQLCVWGVGRWDHLCVNTIPNYLH